MSGLHRLLVALAVSGVTVGCSSAGTTPKTSTPPKTSSAAKLNQDLISTSEIDSQSFRDAYDVVQRLRPNWFTRKTGGNSARRLGASGSGLVVYLENTRMGGIEALRQINTSAIESLQFMDASIATATLPGLGSSVISGAIVARMRR